MIIFRYFEMILHEKFSGWFYLYQFHPFGDFKHQQTLATLRHVQHEKTPIPGIEEDSPFGLENALQGTQWFCNDSNSGDVCWIFAGETFCLTSLNHVFHSYLGRMIQTSTFWLSQSQWSISNWCLLSLALPYVRLEHVCMRYYKMCLYTFTFVHTYFHRTEFHKCFTRCLAMVAG